MKKERKEKIKALENVTTTKNVLNLIRGEKKTFYLYFFSLKLLLGFDFLGKSIFLLFYENSPTKNAHKMYDQIKFF